MKLIVTVPNKVLIEKAIDVINIDKEIKQIIDRMKTALINSTDPIGVGLAAPQIGKSVRIFLMRPEETDPIKVFINPKIVSQSKILVKGIPDEDAKLEGCLSIPKIWGSVNRHKSVTITYLDETGKLYKQTFTGFESVIIQHEMDHLDGTLFTKRVIEQKGQLYQPTIDDKGQEVLEPIDI